MKKNILIIVLCISLILMTNGCNSQTKNKPNNYKDTSSAVDNYFQNAKKDENIAAISYDDEKQVVVVTLIDNNKENQEKFLSNVNVDKKYIEFEQGGTNTFYAKIVTLDSVKEDKISFNKYLTKENRTIYLENNIKELYIFDHQRRWTFKYYVTNTNQSLENSLKSVTDLLEKEANLKDGGTAIYKNKDKNMTVIACNTLNGNKDVYIGDYQLSFKDNMCK